MDKPRSSIFRASAVRRYAESRAQAVLPRLVRSATFVWLWIIAVLLLIGAGLVLALATPLVQWMGR